MHRNYLKQLLNQYSPQSSEEQAYKQRFIDLLDARADCFERTCIEPGHITASAWVINHTSDKVLLLHHAKLDFWMQPGGHCDGDPNPMEVALKEVREETGLISLKPVTSGIFDLDIHAIPARPHEPAHYHYDVRFLVRCIRDETLLQNHESKGLQWFGKDKAMLPNQQLSITRMFDKWTALEW